MIPRLREWLRACARAQGTRRFKVVASVVIASLAVLALASWLVLAYAPDTADAARQIAADATAADPGATAPRAATGAASVRALLGAGSPVLAVSAGILGVAGVLLVITWLGVLLTYVGLGLIGLLVVAPMWAIPSTRDFALVVAGAIALAGSFSALLQGVRARSATARPSSPSRDRCWPRPSDEDQRRLHRDARLPARGPARLPRPRQAPALRVQTFLQWGTAGLLADAHAHALLLDRDRRLRAARQGPSGRR